MKKSALIALPLLAMSFGFVACGSSQNNGGGSGEAVLAQGPDWYENREGHEAGAIYAYGQSAGEMNPALADKSAKASAMTEISEMLETYVKSMTATYLASHGNNDMAEEIRSTQAGTVMTTANYVRGFRVTKSENKGKYRYVRGMLKTSDIKEALKDDAAIKEIVNKAKADAGEFFKWMDEEIDKTHGSVGSDR